MKLLKKLLLIHWYTFDHEIIEFEKLNFLTGANAEGKSTIVDALQIIFLADTSGTFFNKSSGNKSERTLSGYLRGEIIGDSENGIDFLRKERFTSYIAVEFYDEQRKKSFTVGCCFDFYSENDIQKQFFHFEGVIPANSFIVDSLPMDIKTLKTYVKDNYKKKIESIRQKDFRMELNGILGGLNGRFQELFKKAVSFDPIKNIEQFVSDFICDEPEMPAIGQLQQDINQYRQLEDEAKEFEKKLNFITEIVKTYEKYSKFLEKEILYSYIIYRAKLETLINKRQSLQNELSENLKKLHRLEQEILLIVENKKNTMIEEMK